MLEKIFTPYVTLKGHQFVLENLTWQVDILSNLTHYAFGEKNVQINRSALQNRLTLDMLLLSEQGVYAMLNLTDGECCLTIHSTTNSLEETQQKKYQSRLENFFMRCSQRTGSTVETINLGLPLSSAHWDLQVGANGF